MTKYYIAEIECHEKYTPNDSYIIEREGLFKSYREASEWLISKELYPYPVEDIMTGEYNSISFEYDDIQSEEVYYGYIEEWEVKQ